MSFVPFLGWHRAGQELVSQLVDQALEERGREVTLAEIWDDRHDRLAGGFRALGNLDSCLQRCAGGDAHEEALFGCCAAGGGNGVVGGYGNNLVVDFGIEDVRDKVCTDALDLVWGPAFPSERRGDSPGSTAISLMSGL